MEEKEEEDFSVYKRGNVIIIKNNKSLHVKNFCLEISTLNFDPSINEEKDNLGKKLIDCLGIIGIVSLDDDSYLITITDAKLVCIINKKEIYKVLDTNFIKFSDDIILEGDEVNDDEKEKEKEKNDSVDDYYYNDNHDEEIIKQLKELFKNGFYFSNKYDLANSITSQNQIMQFFSKRKKIISDYDYISEGNKNFLSNLKLTKISSFSKKKNIKYYFSNCIYGNIEEFKFEKENLEVILISRRYLWNYGIFNYRRGLSKYGGNSNQIETELILIHDKKELYSNIHLSSYIPIYFKKKKNLQMNDANKAFIKYFKTLIEEYNALFLFALKNKDEDEKYVNKLKIMISKNRNSLENKLKYYCINTEEKTIKDIFDSTKGNKSMIDFIGYNKLKDTQFDNNQNQIGIFSLISMDDKELNKNQLILIYEVIYHILTNTYKESNNQIFLEKDLDIKLFEDNYEKENNEKEKSEKENDKKDGNDEDNTNKKESEKEINEDTINFLNELKRIFKNRESELTKQYYTNPEDEICKKYQRVNEILFGKTSKISPSQNNLNNLKEEFSDVENIKIFVGTWNTASTESSKIKNINLDSWLIPKDSKIVPDIYFVGFEEVVELNASNVIRISEEKKKQILDEWEVKIYDSISKIGNYKKLVEMNLVGINLYFYILEEKYEKVSNISKKIVKTGLGGATGNKGSCCINFDYENTSFSVACSHLAAGESKNKQRIKEIDYIMNLKLNTFYNPQIYDDKKEKGETCNQSLEEIMPTDEENNLRKSTTFANANAFHRNVSCDLNFNDSTLFKDSDIWIFFGDLNFRIDMEYEEFSQYLKSNKWNKLLDYDQFIKFRLASLDLMETIQEDEIKFPPTYKYIIDSNEYDYTPENKAQNPNQNENLHKSGKKRNPSWCDRIFYKKNAYETKSGKKIISGLEYNNVLDDNFKSSDHRPIYQIFDVIIFKENQDKKNLIEREVILNEKLGISNKYMIKKNYDY